MTPSLEGWPTKAKEAPFPHEVRLALLGTNPVFQSLGVNNASIMSFVLTDFVGKIECLSSLNNNDAGVNPVAGCDVSL